MSRVVLRFITLVSSISLLTTSFRIAMKYGSYDFNNQREILSKFGRILETYASPTDLKKSNVLASKYIQILGSRGWTNSTSEILSMLERRGFEADTRTYTSLMSTLIKNNQFQEAMQVYGSMSVPKDRVCHVCYARALGGYEHMFEDWSVVADAFLTECLNLIGMDVLCIAETLVTNLKHSRAKASGDDKAYAQFVLDWLSARKIPPNEALLDALLSLTCQQGKGTREGVDDMLRMYSEAGVAFTSYTYNTLLNSLVDDGDSKAALELFSDMISAGRVDRITFNTMLKLFVQRKDVSGANKVIEYMRNHNVQFDSVSNALLLQLYASTDRSEAVFAFVDGQTDETLTAHMLAIALPLCETVARVEQLYHRAKRTNKADDVVFVVASKALLLLGDSRRALAVMEDMLASSVRQNKYIVSHVLSLCLGELTSSSAAYVKRYLKLCYEQYPQLITDAVCQKSMTELMRVDTEDALQLACQLHGKYMRGKSCKSEVLDGLFTQLQRAGERGSRKAAVFYATSGMTLLEAYASDHRSRLLRSNHFNSVLRLFSLAEKYDSVTQTFSLMQGFPGIGQNRAVGPSYIPTTFTIAELVRAARASADASLAVEALVWGSSHRTFIPPGVLSDAFALLYDKGLMSAIFQLYSTLYSGDYVKHWVAGGGAAIDVHGFNQGMTYAAVTCAIKEILGGHEVSKGDFSELIIITGTNVDGPDRAPADKHFSRSPETFTLSAEVQRALVENFFPPISSSTVPGNPGRIRVLREDIYRSVMDEDVAQ